VASSGGENSIVTDPPTIRNRHENSLAPARRRRR
jgi:hypothetical protein